MIKPCSGAAKGIRCVSAVKGLGTNGLGFGTGGLDGFDKFPVGDRTIANFGKITPARIRFTRDFDDEEHVVGTFLNNAGCPDVAGPDSFHDKAVRGEIGAFAGIGHAVDVIAAAVDVGQRHGGAAHLGNRLVNGGAGCD